MADRKAELERKKKRLLEIRKAKEDKKQDRSGTVGSVADSASFTSSGPSTADIDSLLSGIDLSSVSSSSVTSRRQDVGSQDSQSIASSSDSKPTSPLSAKRVAKLSVVAQIPTNILPRDAVLYNKETQTLEEFKPPTQLDLEEPLPKNEALQSAVYENEERKKEKEKKEDLPARVELGDDQKTKILESQDFFMFMDHASRVIEKALCENDYGFDYGAINEDSEGDTHTSKKLTLNRQFYDDRWSKHRCITCLDWSIQHPELLVASYNQNEDAPQDPDGTALVWNMKFHKNTPEYIFHNQSPVMSVCFAQFHPNLLVGGTYSGQIVLWDNRNRKRTPVQKTPLSASAHTHPVYSVQVIGTQNAHNLITFSTDGKMCQWSLDMLAQPQEVTDLQHMVSKNVSVTCASFLPGDVNNFVVGSEDGSVFSALRHGSKAGIADQFEGHDGPVTAIDYNAVPGPIDFSHLFLTSSFDWTIKLWNNKDQKALYSFEDNGDYVYDVQWSPIHPALFASVDGMGKLELWNLNKDTEVPTTSVTVEALAALNCVKWAASGHQLAAGDDEGHIYIYDVGEQLAAPRIDEWNQLVTTVQELQANSQTVASTSSPEKDPLSPQLSTSFMSPPRVSTMRI